MHSDTQTVLFAGPQVEGVLVSWTNPAALPSPPSPRPLQESSLLEEKAAFSQRCRAAHPAPRFAAQTGPVVLPVPELRSPLTKRAGSSCHGSVVGVSGTAARLTSRTARLRRCLLGVACRVVHGRSAAGIAPRRPPWGVGQWFF